MIPVFLIPVFDAREIQDGHGVSKWLMDPGKKAKVSQCVSKKKVTIRFLKVLLYISSKMKNTKMVLIIWLET